MAKSLLQILFSFVFFGEKKKSESNFWSNGILDLVDFQSTGSWDFLKSFFLTGGP